MCLWMWYVYLSKVSNNSALFEESAVRQINVEEQSFVGELDRLKSSHPEWGDWINIWKNAFFLNLLISFFFSFLSFPFLSFPFLSFPFLSFPFFIFSFDFWPNFSPSFICSFFLLWVCAWCFCRRRRRCNVLTTTECFPQCWSRQHPSTMSFLQGSYLWRKRT